MTRYLTGEEIEYITNFITPSPHIPQEVANNIVKNLKNVLIEQLKTVEVYPEIIEELKSTIKEQYLKSLIQPGESVGILCAQSMGEKNTQTTLNTFHHSGVSNKTMTHGVPRFQELLNATKNPRNINHTIYFNNENKSIRDIRNTVNHTIVGITLEELIVSKTISLDKESEEWYNAFSILYNDAFTEHNRCISIKIDVKKLFEYKLTMQDICNSIEEEYSDLFCVFSPPQQSQIDVFVDLSNINPEDDYTYLNECCLPILEKKYVCGIPGITEVFYMNNNDDWYVETNGFNSRGINRQFLNYKKLLALPTVDYTKTISNDIWDIYEILDIEAARQFLIEEFMSIMDGINECHTSLLVDRMTFNGTISAITRHTLKNDEIGPFGKASFEETMDNFQNAAAEGSKEPTTGVSASIICGKRANMGTGMIDVSINMEELPYISDSDSEIELEF